MSQPILDKSAKIISVESSGAARQLLNDVLKSNGYSDIQGVPTIKDALGMMEVEHIDWVITSIDSSEEANGLNLLKSITAHKELRHLNVSFLIEENETDCLSKAFELGLLSYHSKPYTKDSLQQSFTELFEVFNSHNGDRTLTSSHYLFHALKESGNLDGYPPFQKQLLEMYPGNASLLLNLAEAQCLLNDKETAKTTIHQVKLLAPDLADAVAKLIEEHFGEEGIGETSELSGGNILNLSNVVVVDPDESAVNSCKEVLEGLGVEDIKVFTDGGEALESIKSGEEPSLIIMEWRIPTVTGPILLQQVRHHGMISVPIVVSTGLLEETDIPLLKEMGVANSVMKPSEKDQLTKDIIWTIQQDRMPTEEGTLERKIRQSLDEDNVEEAKNLVSKFLSSANVQESKKRQIEAEFAFYEKDWSLAKSRSVEALKLAGDSIMILNVLGKSLMKLRDFEAALRCFEKAQTMSPLNIERLCQIAEANAEVKKVDAANEALEEAQDIDPDSEKVSEAQAKVAFSQGDSQSAKEILSQLDSLSEVVSFMNNKAVSHAVIGDIDESIELYDRCLDSVPDDRPDVRASVFYNLGLAYAREAEYAQAKEKVEQALEGASDVLKPKVESLLKRLTKAIGSGVALELRAVTSLPKPTEDEDQESRGGASAEDISAIDFYRGDLCCYLIYVDDKPSETAKSMLAKKAPRFKPREAIEREESGGEAIKAR